MKKGICKLCQTEQNLCKSHIVPESFYTGKGKGIYVNIFSDRKYPQRILKGLYEPMLCKPCEDKIGIYEQYAKKILIDDIESYLKYPNYYEIPQSDYNYEKIKKFLLSVLWRMSVSNLDNFKNINLDKYENIARLMIDDKIPLDENLFIFSIRKNPPNLKTSNMVYGIKASYKSTTVYKLTFGGYNLDVFLEYDINEIKKDINAKKMFLLKNQDLTIIQAELINKKTIAEIKERFDIYKQYLDNKKNKNI